MGATNNTPLLRLTHVTKRFAVGGGKSLRAVNDVSLDIFKGETLGVVGESGCGKSTLGRTIIGIYEPTEGHILFNGAEENLAASKNRFAFAKKAQMIFQDPYASLNPRMTVGTIIREGMEIHHMYTPEKRQQRVYELLEKVGLNREHANRFPHEFSGGQRQRIGIARALAIEPEFIVCDEPVSALDVSIQSQIINLLKDLQEEMGLTYMFIAHDLNVVKYISSRIAVMYLGSVVELGDSQELYDNTLHPYSEALLEAVPVPKPDLERQRNRQIIAGDVPSPINPPPGCAFAGRCPHACSYCRQHTPLLTEVRPAHWVACHLYTAAEEMAACAVAEGQGPQDPHNTEYEPSAVPPATLPQGTNQILEGPAEDPRK